MDVLALVGKPKKSSPVKLGLLGNATDYAAHRLGFKDGITGFGLGFLGAFVGLYIFFGIWPVCLACAIPAGLAALPAYRAHRIRKRKRDLLFQFKDLLEALATSYSSGKNTTDAFLEAGNDLKNQYSADTDIVKEVSILISGVRNNLLIEDCMEDFAMRSALPDIRNFAETFIVCNRTGGNLKNVISEVRDILCEKIEIEMEIETTVRGKKNELHIMMIMPFIVTLMLRTLGNEAVVANTPSNILIKLIAIGLFGLSYFVGRKIVTIRL